MFRLQILLPIQMVIEDVAHNKLGATAEETAKNSSFLEAILDSSMEFTWSYLWGHDSVIGNMSISLLGRYAATKILSRHHCSKSQALLVLVLSSSGGYPRELKRFYSILYQTLLFLNFPTLQEVLNQSNRVSAY